MLGMGFGPAGLAVEGAERRLSVPLGEGLVDVFPVFFFQQIR